MSPKFHSGILAVKNIHPVASNWAVRAHFLSLPRPPRFEHVPDHYRHGIRYFGLLAPRAMGHTWTDYLCCWTSFSDPAHERL